eukprot:gene9124-10700_t
MPTAQRAVSALIAVQLVETTADMEGFTILVKDLINDPITTINNFKWETGVTPFSSVYSPALATIAYLAIVFGLQSYMTNRKEFKLHWLCVVHNLFLSLLSLTMLVGIVVPLIRNPASTSLYAAACTLNTAGQMDFWYYVFYLSKVYEFLDTIFLVLRKKSLIFLHVYHHFITFWLCWVNLAENTGVQWADITANCFVHIIMYFYYYKTEIGENPWWKKYITRVQILQFIFDISLHAVWHYHHYTSHCNGTLRGVMFSNYVIFSFLFLFLQFYFRSYKKGGASAKVNAAKKQE